MGTGTSPTSTTVVHLGSIKVMSETSHDADPVSTTLACATMAAFTVAVAESSPVGIPKNLCHLSSKVGARLAEILPDKCRLAAALHVTVLLTGTSADELALCAIARDMRAAAAF